MTLVTMVAEPVPQDSSRLTLEKLPKHLAIIMDGSGRWAEQHGRSRQAGKGAGTKNIRQASETQEIAHAVRRSVEDGVPAERIDEALFSSYLYTAELPDPDLLIRTAGHVTPTYWPDFGSEEIEQALLVYSQLRFGGAPEEKPRRYRLPGRRSAP